METNMPNVSEVGRKINREKFAREYVANGGNGVQAMLKTKPMTYMSAAVRAKDVLKEPQTRDAIRHALSELNIDYNYVLGARQRVINQGIEALKDGKIKVSAADIHNHLTGMENVLARLDKDNSQNHSDIHVHIKNLNFSEVIKQRQSYSKYFDDIIDGETLEETSSPGVEEEK